MSSLYFATGIRWQSPGDPWLDEPLVKADCAAILQVWSAYRRQAGPTVDILRPFQATVMHACAEALAASHRADHQ